MAEKVGETGGDGGGANATTSVGGARSVSESRPAETKIVAIAAGSVAVQRTLLSLCDRCHRGNLDREINRD